MDKTCYTCKYWASYYEIYEDDEEPSDIGECERVEPYECTSEHETCKYWEAI